MSDPSRVQVLYDPEIDDFREGKVVEADVIREIMVVENGVELNVIRHDPQRLAKILFETLQDHFRLE